MSKTQLLLSEVLYQYSFRHLLVFSGYFDLHYDFTFKDFLEQKKVSYDTLMVHVSNLFRILLIALGKQSFYSMSSLQLKHYIHMCVQVYTCTLFSHLPLYHIPVLT